MLAIVTGRPSAASAQSQACADVNAGQINLTAQYVAGKNSISGASTATLTTVFMGVFAAGEKLQLTAAATTPALTANFVGYKLTGGSFVGALQSSAVSTGTVTITADSTTYQGYATSIAPDASNPTGTETVVVTCIGAADPTPTLTFSVPNASVDLNSPTIVGVGQLFDTASSSISGGGAITYTSSASSVAKVGSTSGLIVVSAPGTTTITATQAAKGTVNAQATQTTTVTVNAAVAAAQSVATKTIGVGSGAGLPYTPIAASGGSGSYTYALYDATNATLATLPAGLNFNAATGAVSGTATVASPATTYFVRVTDTASAPATVSKSFSLTVNAATATLSGLAISAGTLSPAFASGTSSYTASVSNATSSIAVTPTTTDAAAAVKINGTTVTSGSASGAIALAVGTNTITTVVTAADGTTTLTYTLTVTRAASSTATLSALAISAGTLSPSFASGTSAYTASVSNATSSIAVTPTTSDATASVKVNGTSVTSGSASGAIALAVGANTITTIVTAADGTTQTYALSVTRAASSTATLSAFAISAGTLSPAFAPGTFAYTASVSNATSSITITPAPTDGTASVKINGVAVASGVATAVALSVGANTIAIVVTAADGTTQTYTLSVTVAPPLPIARPETVTIAPPTGVAGAPNAGTAIDLTSVVSNAASILIVTPPAHGTLTVNGFVVTYVPTLGYYGNDAFAYEAVGLPGTSLSSVARRAAAIGSAVSMPVTITIVIASPTIVVGPTTLPPVRTATAYAATVTGAGGTAPYTFKIASGALPAGLSLDGSSGVIAGTPSAQGTFAFAVSATDSSTGTGPFTNTQTYSLAVAAPTIVLGPSNVPGGRQGVPYAGATFSATGGTAPYTFALGSGSLPNGMSLTPNGALSGTPLASGTFTISVTVTDSTTGIAGVASQSVTLVIQQGAPPVLVSQTAKVLAGQSVTIDPTVGATGGPFTAVAIVTQPANGTVTVSGTNLVYAAAANFSGTATFTYTVANAFATSTPALATVTVNAVPIVLAPIVVSVAADAQARADITTGATGGPFTAATIVAIAPARSGTASVQQTNGIYAIVFTPARGGISGPVVITYTIANAYATSAPGTVTFQVAPRPNPATDADVRGLVTAQTDTAIRFSEAQITNVNARLESLHAGGPGRMGSTLAANIGDAFPEHTSADSPTVARAPSASMPTLANASEPTNGKPLAYWIAGTVDYGLHGQNAAQNGQRSGLRFATSGVTIGIDDALSRALSLGAAIGFGTDKTDIGTNGTRLRASTLSGSIYESYHPNPSSYLDAVLGYAGLRYDTRRFYTGVGGEFENGSRSGNSVFGSVTVGHEFHAADSLLAPYARVQGVDGTLAAFTESGGVGALSYGAIGVNSLRGVLGLHGTKRYASGGLSFEPGFRFEYQHEFANTGNYGLQYADASTGQSYTATVDGYGRDHLVLEIATSIHVPHGSIDFSYTTEAADGSITVHHITVKASFRP